jgi:hypothetical protein
LKPVTQQPPVHRLPGQQGWPGPPHDEHTPKGAPLRVQTVSGSVHWTGWADVGWQQVWAALPHSHWPALQAPVLPVQLWPSLMQRFCQQQLAPLHF